MLGLTADLVDNLIWYCYNPIVRTVLLYAVPRTHEHHFNTVILVFLLLIPLHGINQTKMGFH